MPCCPDLPRCRHCGRLRPLRRRGLCHSCHADKDVRRLYDDRPISPRARRFRGTGDAPPTGTGAALLGRLEAPDCDCPLVLSCPCGQGCVGEAALSCPHCQERCDCPPLIAQEPCAHQRAAGHRLTLERWAELQRRLDPAEYADRPAPAPADVSPSAAEREALYAARAAAGLALFSPADRQEAA